MSSTMIASIAESCKQDSDGNNWQSEAANSLDSRKRMNYSGAQNSQCSSNETVIVCADSDKSKPGDQLEVQPTDTTSNREDETCVDKLSNLVVDPHGVDHLKEQTNLATDKTKQHRSTSNIKNLIQFAGQHLNFFHYHHNGSSSNRSTASSTEKTADNSDKNHASISATNKSLAFEEKNSENSNGGQINDLEPAAKQSNTLSSWTQRYLRLGRRRPNLVSNSAPATPIKWAPKILEPSNTKGQLVGVTVADSSARDQLANGIVSHDLHQDLAEKNSNQQQPARPSVRFVESANQVDTKNCQADGTQLEIDKVSGARRRGERNCGGLGAKLQRQSREQVKFSDCGVQTMDSELMFTPNKDTKALRDTSNEHDLDGLEMEANESGDDADGINFVAQLFKVPERNDSRMAGECPMDSGKFRDYGYKLIDYISNYLDTIGKRRVTPINIEPGYLKSLIQPDAPEQGESFATIMQDFEKKIMCGITHWQHPHFHAYFPAGNAYPSILADMLSGALGCVGFSWAASPAYTELEIIMLDWMGKMIGLPDEFLCLSGSKKNGQESKGGGVIQGSASECVLVNLLAARHWTMEKLRKKFPGTPDGILLSRLIGYCSKEAHSCVEKASMIGFIRMRALETDEKHSLRGETLAKAIEADKAQGLEPFIVCATLGTTSCVSFDNLDELGQVCKSNDDIWLHVDAAYAGSALICPEFKYLMKGIEMVTSFNMNPNKWMLINFDCSLMWVKDRFKLTRAFVVDPLYLQHSFSDQAIDYRHWGIPLSRRFRALKLWFVIRNYGVEGLREYIRNHCRLAKLFEQLISSDKRFMVTNEVVLGLVCFRLIGSNALNQRLLSMINASGKLHMVPASLNGRYVIRFCVCDQNAQESDIIYAYNCISQLATELFESIRAGRERIRAISQQNTIDISSISLHTQQSLSADRLDNDAASTSNNMNEQKESTVSNGIKLVGGRSTFTSILSRHEPAPNEVDSSKDQPQTSNKDMVAITRHDSKPQTPLSPARSPLVKQVSMQLHQQSQPPRGSTETEHSLASNDQGDHEDLEQEVPIDSLATIDGCDYDLYLDDEDDIDDEDYETILREVAATTPGGEQPNANDDYPHGTTSISGNVFANQPLNQAAQHQQASDVRQGRLSRAGRMSRTFAADGNEQEEAADEVLKLTEKRNRMSLRYKREFFVRVVSDPRVYRASISGDINAHASTSSLGSNGFNTTQQQLQRQENQQSDETSRHQGASGDC